MSIADNLKFLRNLPKFDALGASSLPSPLTERPAFGGNPGNLRMFSFAPEHPGSAMPLVVVLHGCTQNAATYETGAGWSTLAERYGFALLMPEQQRANNANTCFNWFDAGDIVREGGEAASIRQMIARMARDHSIDPARVFITGLSAGGAMTSVMLATYPEVFAAGAIIAGLPYGVALNLRDALSTMRHPEPRSAKALGDLVRQASSHRGAWPRVSVWHGSVDRTVHPGNAHEIVEQWLDVHGLPTAPTSSGTVEGYPRQAWRDGSGETIVESYDITGMAHGTPLGLSLDEQRYGAQGPYMIEAGISSSYHIAQFFGLTERVPLPDAKTATKTYRAAEPVRRPKALAIAPMGVPQAPARNHPETITFSARHADDTGADRQRRTLDVHAVITKALTAAGLMK